MNEMNNQNINPQESMQQIPVQQEPVQPGPVAPVSEAPVYAATAVPEKKPKKKKSVMLIISLILNAVLILGVAAAAVFLYVLPALKNNGEAEPVVEEYSEFDFFICGLTPLSDEDGKWGYINEKGEWAIEPQFDYASGFGTNGMAPVCLDDEWGYINAEGKWAIEPKYDYAYSFNNGVAEVEKDVGDDYQYALINEKGEFVVRFNDYDYMDGFYSDGLIYSRVEKDGEHGIIDNTGKVIVEFGEYEYIGAVYKDGFIFAEDKLLGFADYKGNVVLKAEYPELGYETVYNWCIEDDCYNYIEFGDYCEEHAPMDEYPYCAYTGCYNRVDDEVSEYCWEHSEDFIEGEY